MLYVVYLVSSLQKGVVAGEILGSDAQGAGEWRRRVTTCDGSGPTAFVVEATSVTRCDR